jgi:16S rRNA (adenine(1408)-N(1))-methyltransferase
VLRRARREPRTLHIGVDADAAAMRDASRRAARPPAKGGHPNALFVPAAVERLPRELGGLAALVTVTLPWGSLLRGVVAPEEPVVAALAELLGPGGRLELLVSAAPDDRVMPGVVLDEAWARRLGVAYAPFGLVLCGVGRATADSTAATDSAWARRLAIPARRDAWHVSFERR